MRSTIAPILYLILVRTVKSDDNWLSQAQGAPGTAHLCIHFTWQPNMTAVNEVLPQIDKAMIPLGARPHWGKYFTMSPQAFLPKYPNLKDFKYEIIGFFFIFYFFSRNLAKELDPDCKFRNEFLEDNVFVDVQ